MAHQPATIPEDAETHTGLTIQQAVDNHETRLNSCSIMLSGAFEGEEEALKAAVTPLVGGAHLIHAVRATPQHAVITLDKDAALTVLKAGSLTVNGQKRAVGPGPSAHARGLHLFALDPRKDTDAAIRKYFEDRVGAPGCVTFASTAAPWLPLGGGFVLFDTVEHAVKAEVPTRCNITEGHSILAFRDGIRSNPRTVFARCSSVLTEADLRDAVNQELGPGSVLAVQRRHNEDGAEEGGARVALRQTNATTSVLGKRLVHDGQAITFLPNLPDTWRTALRIPRYPEAESTPLAEIVRFYEERLGTNYLHGVTRGLHGTVVQFRTQAAAARGFYLGPVQSSNGPLPAYWFRKLLTGKAAAGVAAEKADAQAADGAQGQQAVPKTKTGKVGAQPQQKRAPEEEAQGAPKGKRQKQGAGVQSAPKKSAEGSGEKKSAKQPSAKKSAKAK